MLSRKVSAPASIRERIVSGRLGGGAQGCNETGSAHEIRVQGVRLGDKTNAMGWTVRRAAPGAPVRQPQTGPGFTIEHGRIDLSHAKFLHCFGERRSQPLTETLDRTKGLGCTVPRPRDCNPGSEIPGRMRIEMSIQPNKLRALLACLPLVTSAPGSPILDSKALLESQTFWDNRDFGWFEGNIPFLDTPDAEINTTYYYRWELVTKHLTYGSPETGYMWTEFINRPFWSGAYGGISCPSGHQFYEARWLRNPRYSRDYARYWFRTPNAQPRRYSAWMADSAWATHLVHPNKEFLLDLMPDLVANFKGWEGRHWVPEAGMFWQVGHDDGMEFNIASRQTKNILSGAPSYRPSFNAYMWGGRQGSRRDRGAFGRQGYGRDLQGKSRGRKEAAPRQAVGSQAGVLLSDVSRRRDRQGGQ